MGEGTEGRGCRASALTSPRLSHVARQCSEPNVRIVIKELTRKGRKLAAGLAAVAAFALAAVGCGSAGGGENGRHPDYSSLAGAPAPLATLYRQAGKRVAFLGVDSQDSDSLATEFLEEDPVPYPSYTDGDGKIAAAIGTIGGLPDTAFYDRQGNLCYLKMGPYTEHSQLAADVRRFALREECEGG